MRGVEGVGLAGEAARAPSFPSQPALTAVAASRSMATLARSRLGCVSLAPRVFLRFLPSFTPWTAKVIALPPERRSAMMRSVTPSAPWSSVE